VAANNRRKKIFFKKGRETCAETHVKRPDSPSLRGGGGESKQTRLKAALVRRTPGTEIVFLKTRTYTYFDFFNAFFFSFSSVYDNNNNNNERIQARGGNIFIKHRRHKGGSLQWDCGRVRAIATRLCCVVGVLDERKYNFLQVFTLQNVYAFH